MVYQIPNIGIMPALGIGTWKLAAKQCEQSVKNALRLGYRHIDTADVYGNHEAVGAAIKGFPREEIFLVSKIVGENLIPENVEKACERFLMELKTPYLDMLLIHWPSMDVSAQATLEEMVRVKEKGLIRHIGVSNFMLDNLEQIEKFKFPIVTNQIELHPYLQEDKLTAYCQKHEMIVTAYRPIQKGEVNGEQLLQEIGEKYNKTAIQVTLRWLFQRNIVSIPKASSIVHLTENVDIFDFNLTPEDMQAITSLDVGKRYVK